MALKKIFDAFQNSTDAQVALLRLTRVVYSAAFQSMVCFYHLEDCLVELPRKPPARQLWG